VPTSSYTPALSDIGALLRDRTVDSGGNEVGTFTANTRPTDTEVNNLVQDAVNDAYTIFGSDIPDATGSDPDAVRKAATRAVAFHAAAMVELSHFGEQVARGNSPYQQYEDQWNAAAKRVSQAIDSVGGDTPGGGDGSQIAIGTFPEDAGGMVGWGTRW
jgi:hypothetical protein